MMAASLLLSLLAGKAIVVATCGRSGSVWEWPMYFWQDIAVVLALAAFEAFLRPRRGAAGSPAPRARQFRQAALWLAYGVVTLYCAVNVPVFLLFSSPLTWTMLRAGGGPLADSIAHYLTPKNLSLIAFLTLLGGTFPFLLAKRNLRITPFLAMLLGGVSVLGAMQSGHTDAAGLDRNPVACLVLGFLPRESPPRETPADFMPIRRMHSREDLAEYRGIARGRNIIMILLESTGARHLETDASTGGALPNVRALASESLVFESAYAVYPESIKGLFSVLSSRYPAIGVRAEDHASAGHPALPQLLRNAGWRTGLFHSGRFMYLGMEEVIANRGFEVLLDAGDIGGEQQSSFGVDEPSTVRRMLEWIDSTSEPFFLTYLPTAGHHPYFSPEPGPFPAKDDADRHRNAIFHGDKALGMLFDGLRARGLFDKTVFVLAGDHGEAFGEHPGNFGHTLYLYEENVRVPMMIAAPQLIRGPVRVSGLSSLIDIAPTLLELLGLPAEKKFSGASLLSQRPETALFFTDYSQELLGLREGIWKCIAERGSRKVKLFDLSSDHGELRDVSKDHPEQVRMFESRLQSWERALPGSGSPP